jgi:capsular exopolysaccharide synthesis family protein
MSEFFRALERAERERKMNGGAGARTHEAPPPPPPAEVLVVEPPRVETPPVMTATIVEEPVFTASVAEPPVIIPEPPAPKPSPTAKPLASALTTRPSRPTGEVDEHLVSLITPDTFEADQYRVLRHTIEQRRRTAGLAIIGVSSAGPGDGKTTTAINLAGALAQDRDARILLVDCDLRSSAMARRLGLVEGRGLVQAIVDPMLTIDDAIKHLPRFNLDVMAAGFETASPYELLKSPRLGELFEAARRRYDYVVVDTPPVLPFPDCRVLAKVVDGFLVVVTAHRTPRRLVDEALGVLPKEMIVGVVFNAEEETLSRSHHAYYGERGSGSNNGSWGSSAKRAVSRAWRDASRSNRKSA